MIIWNGEIEKNIAFVWHRKVNIANRTRRTEKDIFSDIKQ
jgi:hypothetical protein